MDAVARKQFVKKWTRKINFLSYVSCLYVYIVHATVTKVLWRQGGRHRNGNTSNRYLFRTQSRKRSREKFRSKDVGVSYFPLKRISPAKIFFRAFMDREEVEVNKNANTDQGQSSAIMNEQAWSVKYSTLSPERQPFPCGSIAGNPRRPRCAQLARSGGQSQ